MTRSSHITLLSRVHRHPMFSDRIICVERYAVTKSRQEQVDEINREELQRQKMRRRRELREAHGGQIGEILFMQEEEKKIRGSYARYEARQRRLALQKKYQISMSETLTRVTEYISPRDRPALRLQLAISYAEMFLDRLADGEWPSALKCEQYLDECRRVLQNEHLTMHAQNAAMRTSLKRFKKMQLMVDGKRIYVYVLPPASEQLLHIFKTAPRGFGLRERAREVLITRHGVDPGPADDIPAP